MTDGAGTKPPEERGESLLSRVSAWRTARRERRREKSLEASVRRLRDEVYDLRHWSFADRPSRYDDRLASIRALIQDVEKLGGDPDEYLFNRRERQLLADALPEHFVRVRDPRTNYIEVERR